MLELYFQVQAFSGLRVEFNFVFQVVYICTCYYNFSFCDFSLNPSLLTEAGLTAGSAAVAPEVRKHSPNDTKCFELGWTCIPLVVESYGAWVREAVQAFSRLASHLATRTNTPSPRWSLTCMAT